MQSRGSGGCPQHVRQIRSTREHPGGWPEKGLSLPVEVPPGVEGWSRGLLRSSLLTRAFDFVLPVTVSINAGGKSLPARAWAVG